MKKNLMLVILLILSTFLLVGCNKKEVEEDVKKVSIMSKISPKKNGRNF